MDKAEGIVRIWLSELQKHCPETWESLLIVQALRS